jgi:hypothetical protein
MLTEPPTLAPISSFPTLADPDTPMDSSILLGDSNQIQYSNSKKYKRLWNGLSECEEDSISFGITNFIHNKNVDCSVFLYFTA